MQRASVGAGAWQCQIWAAQKCEASAAPAHTHTLPWLWLCATLIDVPAKPASPRHATPPARLTAAVYMSMAVTVSLLLPGCNWHRFPHQSNSSSRAAEAAAAAKMLQQDDSSTWAKKLPQFSNYSQNFMPTKATHSMHRQPKGVCHTHTQMGLVGRQVLCNIFGLPLPAAVATKTNLCSCAAHSNTTSNVPVCVCCVRVCVWVLNFTLVRFSFHLLAKMLGKNSLNVANILLCLWLDFRCILTLYSPLPLSPSLFNFCHISANTFPTSFSITLMEAQRQKFPNLILILEFFSMVSFINCLDYLHLTRFSWADKWQLIARPNEYPSQRQKTTKS